MSTSSRGSKLRLVLFVEGTSGPPLDGLWREEMAAFLGFPPFERIVGIGKNHLVAMSNANLGLRHRTSTVSVGLDSIIANELKKKDFDCAVVAWDLVPAWDSGSDASACRWRDTLLLYEGLARSKHLPAAWRKAAEQRYEELSSRAEPSERKTVPQPAPNTVLSVCMEPEFESMLLHEAGVKEVLGLKGRPPRDWPKTWKRLQDPRPSDTLAQAIADARQARPKPEVFRKVPLPLREAKHEWGRLFINSAAGAFRKHLLKHPTSARLKELLTRPTEP